MAIGSCAKETSTIAMKPKKNLKRNCSRSLKLLINQELHRKEFDELMI